MSFGDNRKPINQYLHNDKKRANNPEVGLVTPETDKDLPKTKYSYDPHLDPKLQWAGKEERSTFDVSTVSLHVHERIDPRTIIERAISNSGVTHYGQGLLFESWSERKPIREAIEFYQHEQNWTNRLIAGDSLLIMNSLLEKEGMSEKAQMVYIDPPYGITYGSNFQPFVNKRDVKDGKDDDLSSEPEMIKAFRDTWELGIHSYLSYLRDRLLCAKYLLNESGSCFVQISDQNMHLVRNLMDEIFGPENFIVSIVFTKTGSKESGTVDPINDYIIWYAKNRKEVKIRKLFIERNRMDMMSEGFKYLSEENDLVPIPEEYDMNKVVRIDPITSDGYRTTTTVEVEFDGKKYYPGEKNHWKTSVKGLEELNSQGRLYKGKSLGYIRKFLDFPVKNFSNLWTDLGGANNMAYVVQTNEKAIERCVLMCSDPGDLIIDPTCGSGTTAYVAEQWGRRWITCDTSRVAILLAKQRLLTAYYDYYQLAQESEGVSSGFKYNVVPHITLGAIANKKPFKDEQLYDKPLIDRNKHRVTGPFTVESVPAPTALSLENSILQGDADASVTRTGETLKQAEWRDELLKTGIRGKGGQYITFSRVEAMMGTRWIQAEGDTVDGKRALFIFGPEYAPMEQRQVEQALREAESLRPRPDLLIFLAFQFDSEAAKDIDEINWQDITLLRVQMNSDLFTEDLKKKRSSDDSFWLIGQPDVGVERIKSGIDKGKYVVKVLGFDYYNTKTGNVESGGINKIAMWMLDTDYDERSLFPTQIFFPMSGKNEGWGKLAKNLKAELDEEKIESFRGTLSLPFEKGENAQISVKIIDDRGIESVRVLKLE